MAKTFSELQALALQIRDEILEKKNTAPRVGAALLDMIDNTIQNITDINQKLSVFEHVCSGFKRVQSESQLPVTPPEDEKAVGYLVGKNLYLYVGKGGNAVDGRYFNVGDITGPQGELGPQGLIGPVGPKGEQGNSGVSGSTDNIEVVNNLDGGESTPSRIKVLAAEQGKVLKEKLSELEMKFNELNISSLYPTNGIDGGNTYTLETAIAQVKQQYRVQGVKVTFVNENEIVEAWEFQGINWWDPRNFSEVGAKKIKDIQKQEDNERKILNSNKNLLLEKGGINLADGSLENSDRLRTSLFLKSPFYIKLNPKYVTVGIIQYKDGIYQNREIAAVNEISKAKDEYEYKITFKKADGSPNNELEENIVEIYTDDNNEPLQPIVQKLSENDKIQDKGIEQLGVEISAINSLFVQERIEGDYPVITLSNLSVNITGNISADYKNYNNIAAQYLTANLKWSSDKEQVFGAFLISQLSDEKLLNISTDGDFANLRVELNYGINAGFQNKLERRIIKYENGRYLLYFHSGRIANKDDELPTTLYLRVEKNTDVSFKVDKAIVFANNSIDVESILSLLKYNLDEAINWNCVPIIKSSLSEQQKNEIIDETLSQGIDRKFDAGIAFWGSSTTEGEWVKDVAARLNMNYYWGGVGGENMFAILGRMGVLPLRLKQSITIPATTEKVEFPDNYNLSVRWKNQDKEVTIWVSQSVQDYKLLVNPCYIAGVKGNLVGKGANSETLLGFQRLEEGEEVTTNINEPIFTYGFQQTRDSVWFLACHFNGGPTTSDELVELYQKCYEFSQSKKVLILGRHRVANGREQVTPTLEELQEQEEKLYDTFGLMFFNTRQYMCTYGLSKARIKYADDESFIITSQDEEDAAKGITPNCFYVDETNVHFNKYGYGIMIDAIVDRIIQLGYNLFRYAGDKDFPQY